MLFLKLILDDWSIQNTFKTVKEFEFSHYCVVIIKALSNHRCESSFQLFDFLSEHNKIIIKLFFVDVHGVIRKLSEILNSLFELFWDLFDSFWKSLTFCTSQLNSLKFIELHDGGCQVKNIMAPFRICVKSWEQGIKGKFPFSLRFIFVFKIVFLKFWANINCSL